MSERITHRGPDSVGYLASQDGQAHLGFRRLAIRDLDARANQPMLSRSGRTAIVFNGEVYNSVELAERYLSGFPLRTSGDTEVVLELLEKRGLDVLPELNGMFALAVTDMASGRVALVRDRMGKKPLYVFEDAGVVAFSSELRSLKPFGLKVDPRHAGLFLHFGYFPSPYTFFENTTQVCPGEIVQLHEGRVESRSRFHWFTDQVWGEEEISNSLDRMLRDSVRLRKLSDVPLGAFLSGGIDSALVAAYLSKQSDAATPTFTVAFSEQAHDEATDAAMTAKELSLPHRTIEILEQDLSQLAAEYVDCYEQPYADSSGLVTMLLCRAVKEHVTVALSGDGGDEFFGGYARYSWFRKGLAAQKLPSLARAIGALGLSKLDRKRGRRLARWLTARDPAELYTEILRTWNACEPHTFIDSEVLTARHSVSPVDLVRQNFHRTRGDELSKAACFDACYYIPDDLQVKLDRASMRVALEVRCPLLDHRVAELGISLGTESKYRHGLKSTLKRLLQHHVSPEVLNRPKHGFSVPLARWLQGPMRTVVGDTLGRAVLRESGWLEPAAANRVWDEFLAGRSQHAQSVWMLFCLSHHLVQGRAHPLFTSLGNSDQARAA